MLDLQNITKKWTLFLDRDGVINHDKDNDYIRNWDEFRFYDTTLTALSIISKYFNRICVTTNQKGVGKGLMSLADLTNIHTHMTNAITSAGGRIDKIYFCSDLADNSYHRKPNPGMVFQAKADYPEIDFSKSLIVGNRISDMQFGRNAGIYTVFVATTHPETPYPNPVIDLRYDDLIGFAQALSTTIKS